MKSFVNSHKSLYIICTITILLLSICVYLSVSNTIVGDGGDNLEIFSYLYLVKDNILHHKSPLAHTTLFRYPNGFDLSLGSDQRAFVLMGGALGVFLPMPFVYNLLILLVLIINFYTSYLLFSTMFSSRRLGYLGGILYGLSSYPLIKMGGHINLMQIYGFPIVGLAIWLLIKNDESPKKTVFTFFLGLLLCGLSSLQYLALAGVGIIVTAYIYLLCFPRRCVKIITCQARHLPLWIPSIFIFLLLIFLLFPSHSRRLLLDGGWNPSVGPIISRSIPWYSDFLPTAYTPTILGSLFYSSVQNSTVEVLRGIGAATFWGYLEIAIFSIWIITSSSVSRLLLFVPALVFYYISLGPSSGMVASLITPIYYMIPFRFVMETDRYFLLYYLFICISIVSWIKGVAFTNKKIIWFFVFVLLLERIQLPFITSIQQPNYAKKISTLPGKAVIDIPILWMDEDYYIGVYHNLLPFTYKKAVIDGYFHWMGETEESSALLRTNVVLSNLRCARNAFTPSANSVQQAITNLKSLDIHVIVVHKEWYALRASCVEARHFVSMLLPGNNLNDVYNTKRLFTKVYEDDLASVYTF